MKNTPLMILIDGHSLAFRAYYAFAKGRDGGLKTKSGIPTSVCFGFLKSLLELVSTQKPDSIAIAFDLGLPTFRHQADHTYKSDRPDTPEDFITDLGNLQELLTALNIPIFTAINYEADDVLGTLAIMASNDGYAVKIVSGDRDLFQLVDDEKNISVLYLNKNFLRINDNNSLNAITTKEVIEVLGVLPTQVVDYKALCGDASDQIPGVSGIGPKTAVKLITEYGSLDNIYKSIYKIKSTNKNNLEKGKESAYHSQNLAKIVTDINIDIDWEQCKLTGFDQDVLIRLLEKLEFKVFINKLRDIQTALGGENPSESSEKPLLTVNNSTESSEQLSLFTSDENQNLIHSSTLNQGKASIPQIKIINTLDKLDELITQLLTCTNPQFPVSWDTETNDLSPNKAKLVSIGCCWDLDHIAYIPINHKMGENLDQSLVLNKLKPILEGDEYPKVFQNVKFDRLVFRNQGINLSGIVFDTMLASYVLNPDNSVNLTSLSQQYLGLYIQDFGDIVPKKKTIDDIEIPTVAEYCGLQVYAVYQLVGKLTEKLAENERLNSLFKEVELPLESVLADMEYTGIKINPDELKELSKLLESQLKELEKTAYELAGQTFNLSSPKQLSEILFIKLGLDIKKTRKITFGYSTDAATLEKLQGDHLIIDVMLEHRTLSKLKSTYVDALPEIMMKNTHRVHTSFNQTGTVTGRLSSSDPNLQNIPIKTEFSRQIRKAFIPETEWLMIGADYSQIELRILAHLSQEPVLIKAYQNNQDIHTLTAKLLLEKEDITSEERRLGKIINFGVIYGMGAARFAKESGIKFADGKKFIDRFCQKYPRVFAYLEEQKRKAIALGYVETILGRRRYFKFEGYSLRNPRTKNPDEIDLGRLKPGQFDGQLLRAAANATIQGSSADIIKIAMIKVQELLRQYEGRLLLQVHDELVFEIPTNEAEELQRLIKEIMENAVKLTVPLIADIHSGNNWMETK